MMRNHKICKALVAFKEKVKKEIGKYIMNDLTNQSCSRLILYPVKLN